MSESIETLLVAFVDDFRRSGGEADPVEYIKRADEAGREELAGLIDVYLSQAPGRAWNADAFASSSAERLTDRLERALLGSSGEWPLILPSHRHEAELTRSEVVKRLAEKLDADNEAERVAAYYHEMESGVLPSKGVSDTVLAALGEIFDTTVAALRRAGQALGGDSAGFGGAVFTRVSGEGEGSEIGGGNSAVVSHADQDPLMEVPAERRRDRIDQLFLGDEE